MVSSNSFGRTQFPQCRIIKGKYQKDLKLFINKTESALKASQKGLLSLSNTALHKKRSLYKTFWQSR